MKKWTKPEMYIENFELTQTVATACKTVVHDKPTEGGSVTYTLTCNKTGGNGHWDHYDVAVYDSNNNGKIDASEWYSAYTTAEKEFAAKNGIQTGGGHRNHTEGSFLDLFNS